MTNTITPPNARSNNVTGSQPLATQQPTTTENIKDSAKSAINKAQNVLTGSNTKTMTPPSNNDVGCTDKHGAKCTGHENRLSQQTGAVPQRTNLVLPSPQQQMGNKLAGNNAFGNTRSGNVAGNIDNVTDTKLSGTDRPVRGATYYLGPVNPIQPDLDIEEITIPSDKLTVNNALRNTMHSANVPGSIIVEGSGPIDITLSGTLTGRSANDTGIKISGTGRPGATVQIFSDLDSEDAVPPPAPQQRGLSLHSNAFNFTTLITGNTRSANVGNSIDFDFEGDFQDAPPSNRVSATNRADEDKHF
ncbi:hypothetical protein GGI17_000915 [Coemansia sp. S146]|nr:hypothetical protein GGI17_000915 [Coemansia sp. S146]